MAENVSVVFFPSLPLNVNRGPLGLIFSPWPGNRQTLNLSEWMGMDRNGWEWMRMPNSFFPLGQNCTALMLTPTHVAYKQVSQELISFFRVLALPSERLEGVRTRSTRDVASARYSFDGLWFD